MVRIREFETPTTMKHGIGAIAFEDSQTIGNPRDIDLRGYEKLYRRALAGA